MSEAGLYIVADENMPALEGLASRSRLQRLPGRSIRRDQLMQADVLLVRSVTRVDASLLAGTPVRFVGSATIGTDHVDLAWLQAQGIRFAHAPGCNAVAVAEYVLQAVVDWLLSRGRTPESSSIGIVGCGNVGTHVARLMRALGLGVVCCDPPRARAGHQDEDWQPLAAALACDVVTLHVPLTNNGVDATRHLLGQTELAAMGAQRLLVNTCRGSVVDQQALLSLPAHQRPQLVFDVWEQEPRISVEVFRLVRSGSPHVAGYSVEGKWRGTAMVCEALGDWAGVELAAAPAPAQPRQWTAAVETLADVLSLLRSRYDLRRDHQALAAVLVDAEPAAGFDRLRRDYPSRYEMAGVQVTGGVAGRWQALLDALGVVSPASRCPA